MAMMGSLLRGLSRSIQSPALTSPTPLSRLAGGPHLSPAARSFSQQFGPRGWGRPQPSYAPSPSSWGRPSQFPNASSPSSKMIMNLTNELNQEASDQKKRDHLHILLKKNNTFISVTDSDGNKKMGVSAGSVEKGRLSRYAAESTAEHVGRASQKMGLKSVIVKVKGNTFFRRKRKVILSWREGFRAGGVGDSPIISIHDVTQLPHNGCRLRKKRRS